MADLGKWMFAAGVVLVVLGGLSWWLGPRTGSGWLPGDLVIRRGGMTFAFPIVTCLVVSVVLSVLMKLFSK